MKRFFVLVAVLVATVSLASCRSLTPAIVVNGTEISMDDFEQDLRDFASSDLLASDQLVVDGRATPDFVAFWATRLVFRELLREENARRGLTVTAADRAAARDPAFADFYAELPDDLADRWIDLEAQFRVLEAAADSDGGIAAVQQEIVQGADVHIDPRYHLVWDPLQGVIGVPLPPVRAERPTSPGD